MLPLLCSPPPAEALGGVPKEGATGEQMPPSLGPNTLPLQDPGTFHSHGVSPIRNARHLLHGCGLGGGLGHSPHHGQATAGCGEGETCCPACSRGEGMAWFLSVCNFSSAFIKHQLIL